MGTGRADTGCIDTIHRIFGLIDACSLDGYVAERVTSDAGEKSQEVIWACAARPAVIRRQSQHLCAGYAGRNGLRLGVDEFGDGFDRHLLRCGPDYQFQIHAHSLPRC